MKFTKNMGTADRLLRTFLIAPAAAAGAVVLGAGSGGAIVLWIVAVVMLATSAVGYCPLFAPFGVSTVGGVHRGASPRAATHRTSTLTHAG